MLFATFASTVTVYLCQQYDDSGKTEKSVPIGERFHHATSLNWTGAIGGLFGGRPNRPPMFNSDEGRQVIELPVVRHQGLTVEEALSQRRSVRRYSDRSLPIADLSRLLFAAQGVTGSSHGTLVRAAPSAGARYPIEVYAVVNRVAGLEAGIYHYRVREHALGLVKSGEFRNRVTRAGMNQDMLGEACVTFVLTAVFDRTRSKYGERGFRYVYTEVGHISQNLYLQAVSLGLGSVAVGAFLDEEMNRLVEVDGHREAAIYVHAVGVP